MYRLLLTTFVRIIWRMKNDLARQNRQLKELREEFMAFEDTIVKIRADAKKLREQWDAQSAMEHQLKIDDDDIKTRLMVIEDGVVARDATLAKALEQTDALATAFEQFLADQSVAEPTPEPVPPVTEPTA